MIRSSSRRAAWARVKSGAFALVVMAACTSPDPSDGDEGQGGSGGVAEGGRGGGAGGKGGGAAGNAAGAGSGGGSGGAGGSAAGATGGGGSAGGVGGAAGTSGGAAGGTGGAAGATGGVGGGGMGGAQAAWMITYAEHCGRCHGPEGRGGALGPDIVHPVRDFGTWLVRNGRLHPRYPEAMEKYSETQVPAAHLTQIFDWLDMPAKATTGVALYRDFCMNCHDPDGKGASVGNRTLIGKTEAEFIMNVRSGHHAGEFVKRNDFMPKWSAQQITDAEIRLIRGYVAGL